jgi:2Fe-2S iron-sulfur cluster binding domain
MSETKQPIKFTLDGREVEAPAGETIFRTARRYGIELPNLCYSPSPGYRPDGNCRVCASVAPATSLCLFTGFNSPWDERYRSATRR